MTQPGSTVKVVVGGEEIEIPEVLTQDVGSSINFNNLNYKAAKLFGSIQWTGLTSSMNKHQIF